MQLFRESFHSINLFLEDCGLQTYMSQEVEEIDWIEGKKVITFNANTSLLSDEEIITRTEIAKEKFIKYRLQKEFFRSELMPEFVKKNLKSAVKSRPKRVEVMIYDINYLLKDPKQFYKDIKITSDMKMYRNELVNSFLW